MYSILPLASSVLLASGALGQYGYGGGAGMSSSMATDLTPSSSMPMQDMAGSSTMSAASTMTGAAAPSGTGGMVNMHVVKVSNKNGDLVFEPKDMQAKVGEMVQFQFYPKNHSVVQASFDMPCMPMKNSMGTKGLFSGYMPVKPTDTTMPAYTIMVNDTKPIWYYCSQGNHCQSGMVGVINPPATNKSRTIDSFMALAKAATSNTSPMEGTTGGMASTSGNASTTMTTISSNTTMPMPSSSAGVATQSKSAAYSSRYASKQDVFTGVGLASAVGLIVAFVL